MAQTDIVAKLKLDISDYTAKLNTAVSQTKTKIGGLSDKQTAAIQSVASTATKTAKVITVAAVAGLTAFTKSAFDAYNDFETSMSQVAATLGYSVEELHDPTTQAAKDLERLKQTAIDLGRSTKFTGKEAADALNYMALAGYNADTSIQMLPTVLNLAAAGCMDLARASDMITDSQTALGLSIEQTVEFTDQMASAASNSNTSVEQLGEAILTVGGTARYMAGGTKELNTVLGIFADNGVKGAEAGTHLRNVLLRLSNPTEQGQKLLNQLGVAVFDAEGKMRSFADIFPELSEAMAGFTDQQKLDAFSTLFNVRDISTANALLNTTRERWEELGNAIADSAGAAEQMAAVQLDNLQGDIVKLESAWEDFKRSFAEKVEQNAGLREAVQSLTNFISEHGQEIADAIANIVAGIINIAISIGKILADNPWIVGVAAAIIGIIDVVAVLGGLISGIGTIITAVGAVASVVVPAIGAVIAALTSPIGIVVAAIAALIGIITFLATHWEEVCNFIGGLLSWLGEFFATVGQGIADVFASVIDGIVAAFQGAWDFITGLFGQIGSFFANVFGAAFEAVKKAFANIGNFFLNIFNTIADLFRGVGQAIGNAVSGAFKAVVNGIIGFVENFINIPVNAINGLLSVINMVPGVNISYLPRMNLPRLESGGVVPSTQGGRIILAGEGGQDEWVVPESKMASLVSQINDRLDAEDRTGSITINLSGVFATSAEERRKVADQIVEAISQNNRRRFA